MNKSLLVIASHDSFIKAGYYIGDFFKSKNYSVEYYLISGKIDRDHLNDIGFCYEFTNGRFIEIFKLLNIGEYTAIFLSLPGDEIALFIKYFNHYLKEKPHYKRPILFGGYVGLVLKHYIKGVLNRQGLDVFYLNSKHDYDRFSQIFDRLDIDKTNMYITGLPYIEKKGISQAPDKRPAVLFAGQSIIPKDLLDRAYLLESFINLANENPDIDFYFKPRTRLGQTSYHEVSYHYESIYLRLKKTLSIPENFLLTYDSIDNLLKYTTMCVTVSSTVAMEALTSGLSLGIINDLGIHEELGNNIFIGSGFLISIKDVPSMLNLKGKKLWIENNLGMNGNSRELIYNAVEKKCELQNKSSSMLSLRKFGIGLSIGDYYRFIEQEFSLKKFLGLRFFIYRFLEIVLRVLIRNKKRLERILNYFLKIIVNYR